MDLLEALELQKTSAVAQPLFKKEMTNIGQLRYLSFISGCEGGRVLSKETARCFSPPSDITPASLSPIQPITQSVHTQGSVTGHGESAVGGGHQQR